MKKILSLIVALCAYVTVSAQEYVNSERLYIYGIAYSLTDSVAYMTDLLYIENAQMKKSSGFLYGRSLLSSQLKKYMEDLGEKNLTCCVVYNPNLDKIDKDYVKQVAKYKKRGIEIRNVSQAEFRFTAVRDEE